MKNPILSFVLVVFVSASPLVAANADYPPISIVAPGSGKSPADKAQFLILVVEGGFISCEGVPIPQAGVVGYVNGALKAKGASILGVHIRQGTKYGDVVKALDELRKTEAKSIGVSMAELAPGKDP